MHAAVTKPHPFDCGRRQLSAARDRILIVEDDASLRHLVATLLQRAGYETVEAESGEEGLELARQDRRGSSSSTSICRNQRLCGMQRAAADARAAASRSCSSRAIGPSPSTASPAS